MNSHCPILDRLRFEEETLRYKVDEQLQRYGQHVYETILADWSVGLKRIETVLHQMQCGLCRERMHAEVGGLDGLKPECSVCRGRHGEEIRHASE